MEEGIEAKKYVCVCVSWDGEANGDGLRAFYLGLSWDSAASVTTAMV